jgi:hypothetical protein
VLPCQGAFFKKIKKLGAGHVNRVATTSEQMGARLSWCKQAGQSRGDLGVCPVPEPSTIGFLGLGTLIVLGFKKYRKVKKKS